MATDQIIAVSPLTVIAGADLSSSGYCAVTINSSGLAVLPSAGGTILGVAYSHPVSGRPCKVYTFGSGALKAKLGGTVAKGDILKVDTSGRFLTASAGDIQAGAGVAIALVGGSINGTGLVVLIGSAGAAVQPAAIETKTSGALSASTAFSRLSTTGAVAYTLPDGSYDGQIKEIEEITAATSPAGTLTITTPLAGEPSTHVFRAIGARLRLVWYTSLGWHVIGKVRKGALAVVVGTTVLTGEDMVERYTLSVTATVSSTGTKAIPDGLVNGEVIEIRVGTAASTPLGNIDCNTRAIATGTNTTHLTALDATTDYFVGEWQDGQFLALGTSGITIN